MFYKIIVRLIVVNMKPLVNYKYLPTFSLELKEHNYLFCRQSKHT